MVPLFPSLLVSAIDDELSKRELKLDPAGYFIFRVDAAAGVLLAEHYGNTIDDRGLACDPRTGKPIPCTGTYGEAPVQLSFSL